MNGSADVEHAIWLAEQGSPAAPAAVADAAFWVDRQLREAATSAGRAALVDQRKRLTEAAAGAGVVVRGSGVSPGAGGIAGGPQTQDFTELGLTETEATSAVAGLRAGRYLSFEDAFWSTRIFEATNSASAAPDPAKLREKARKFAGAQFAVSERRATTAWGRPISEGRV